MIPIRSSLWCVLAVAAVGCHGDAVTNSPVVPKAGIHYLNAIPDTGAMDFRVVDIVSNSGLFTVPFRGMNVFPQGIEAGNRDIRVFMDGTTPGVASTVMFNQTFSFTADLTYSFLAYGYARSGQIPAKKVLVTTATPPAVAAGQVHVRVINLASTLAPLTTTPLDAWVVAPGAAALSGSPTIANVAFENVSAYASAAAGVYRMAFTAAGTTTPILFEANMPTGVASSDTTNPIAGTNLPGTALTALVVPQSAPGSAAPSSFAAIQAITSLTSAATTATAVTSAPHNLTTGDAVIVNGADTAVYNGSFPVTVVNATTFTYTLPRATTGSPATGYPFWLPDSEGSAFNGNPISRLTSTGTTATVVTQSAHGFATNDIVTIAGANEAAYNGSFAVTVVDASTFTYATNGLAASPATGAPIFRGGASDFTRPNVVFIVDRRPANTIP